MSNLEEPLVATPVCSDVVCIGCRFAHGEPPWADAPNKAYCKVYRREDGLIKPSSVLFKSVSCEFREPE